MGTTVRSGYFSDIGLSSKKLQIGTNVLLIITSTGDVLLSGINVHDPE